MSSVVKEAKYIKSDVHKNNNKFWYITLFDDYSVETHWGRVGDDGQRKTKPFSSQYAAESFFDKKCKEKERSGRNGEIAYRPLNVINGTSNCDSISSVKSINKDNVERIAKKQIQTNDPTVIKLIEYLSKVNAHNITSASGGQITYNDTTGLFSTPLGIVTQDNIDEANDILIEIGDMVANRTYNEKLNNRTNDYLMLIPQNFGRKRLDIQEFWSNLTKVQYQKSIVDSLQASVDSATSKSKSINVPENKIFDVKINIVEDNSVIRRIHNMYHKSKKGHSCSYLNPSDVYEIKIGQMADAWERDGAKMTNIWNLWHGSSCANLISIFSKGFMIPPRTSSNVTGRMFSDGIYASNISTKALGYSTGYWGQSSHNRHFMFLIDMAMGKYYIPPKNSDNLPKHGYDSTFAKPEVTISTYNNRKIRNEEMIVYRTSQVNPKYLVEFK